MSATAFLKQLNEHESQLLVGKGNYKQIYDLINLMNDLESSLQIEDYQELVLPKLVPFLALLIDNAKIMAEADSYFNDHDVDMSLMRHFVKFQYLQGLETIAELMMVGHKEDDSWWYTILSVCIEDKETAEIIVNKLDGRLPNGHIGIRYLDMLNAMNLKGISFEAHPFSSPQGIARLEQYLTNDYPAPSKDNDGNTPYYAAVALAFLPENVWKKLLPIALAHKNKDVQIEAMWAGTKLKDKDSLEMLIEETKDYRYSEKCVRYLRELGLDDLIPEECQANEFAALAEMAAWLVKPNEFGTLPTELSIVESRTLFWSPEKEKLQLTIVRYRYEKWNKDGTDKVGIALVKSGGGHYCFAELNERTPDEIYAICCAWDMKFDDYNNPEVGMRLLREHNPGFGES